MERHTYKKSIKQGQGNITPTNISSLNISNATDIKNTICDSATMTDVYLIREQKYCLSFIIVLLAFLMVITNTLVLSAIKQIKQQNIDS